MNPKVNVASINQDQCIKCGRCIQTCPFGAILIKAIISEQEILEGMACDGGCIGGPGTMSAMNSTGKEVTKFSGMSQYKSSFKMKN